MSVLLLTIDKVAELLGCSRKSAKVTSLPFIKGMRPRRISVDTVLEALEREKPRELALYRMLLVPQPKPTVYGTPGPHPTGAKLVYFASVPRQIKIGSARNVERRLLQLQTSFPYRIKLLGTLDGGERREREIHTQFDHLRLGGEWFRAAPELHAFIKQECGQ